MTAWRSSNFIPCNRDHMMLKIPAPGDPLLPEAMLPSPSISSRQEVRFGTSAITCLCTCQAPREMLGKTEEFLNHTELRTRGYLRKRGHGKPSGLLLLSFLESHTTFHFQPLPQCLQRPNAAGWSIWERCIKGLSQLGPHSVPVHSGVGVFPKILNRVHHRMNSP